MKKIAFLLAFGFSLLSFHTIASAQYVKNFGKSGRWEIVHTELRCMAVPRDNKLPALALIGTKTGHYNVMLSYKKSSAPWIEANRSYNLLTMLGNNIGFQGIASGSFNDDGNPTLQFENMPAGNIDGFGRGSAVTIKLQTGQTLPAISLKGAGQMISSLRSCMRQKL